MRKVACGKLLPCIFMLLFVSLEGHAAAGNTLSVAAEAQRRAANNTSEKISKEVAETPIKPQNKGGTPPSKNSSKPPEKSK